MPANPDVMRNGDRFISVKWFGGGLKRSMVSQQNLPQSATVLELKQYSCMIWWAGSRHTIPYVRSEISRKVSLLSSNQEPVVMDLVAEHRTPATILRHCQ